MSYSEKCRLSFYYKRKLRLNSSRKASDIDAEMKVKLIFSYLERTGNGGISIEHFLKTIQAAGFYLSDPRVKFLKDHLDKTNEETINLANFQKLVKLDEYDIIGKSCTGALCIPKFQDFCKDLDGIYHSAKEENLKLGKKPLDAFSDAAAKHKDCFGVSICSIDGQRHDIGDTNIQFPMEGCCKPMLYCMALEEHGQGVVHEYISYEPSGMSLHMNTLLKKGGKKRPHNPLMSTGAIVCSSLISSNHVLKERISKVLHTWNELVGNTSNEENPIAPNSSERGNSSRNFSLGYMLEHTQCFPPSTKLHETIEFFLQNSSILTTTRELAVFAATLASGGICPTTQRRVFDSQTVHYCLSVLHSCGMGKQSGAWTFTIGLPATRTVNGAIMVVIPGILGICSWSPLLNDKESSAKGNFFFQKLVDEYKFHNFDNIPGNSLLKKDPRRESRLSKERMIRKLLYAAAEGDVCELRRLSASGVDINSHDYDQRTALHLAASEGKMSAVRYLLRHNVHLAPKDRWGGTPLSDARKFGQGAVALLLLKAGVANDAEERITLRENPLDLGVVALFYAAKAGDTEKMKQLLEDGVNIDSTDYDHRTALHIAASEGKMNSIEFLLNSGCNLNVADSRGNTPLMDARIKGNMGIVDVLAKRLRGRKTFSDALEKDDVVTSDDETNLDDYDEHDISSHSANQYLSTAVDMNNEGLFSIQELFETLQSNGLQLEDPRLKRMIDNAKMLGPNALLSSEQYRHVTESGAILLEKAIRGTLVISNFDQFCDDISDIYLQTKPVRDGNIADYIPQLAAIDPEKYGVSICSIDGQRFSIGDYKDDFCVQSCSKPISYCIALEELDEERVHYHMGCEPSGLSFNELDLMKPKGGVRLPHNPMINAGAIMSSGLIYQNLPIYKRFDKVMNIWSDLCGKSKVGFDNSVYLSERGTADRNFCLGYMMKEAGCLPEGTNLQETLDFYFQQCSLSVNTEQFSILAATLANGGVCPVTNQRIFSSETVRNCLSLMYSCGMYDYSGEWGFRIGLPAKSGVSGAIITVIPNVMGVCTWSPRLDNLGNSVRGIAFCKALVEKFSFHTFDQLIPCIKEIKCNPVYVDSPHMEIDDMKYRLMYASAEGNVEELNRLKLFGVELDTPDYDGRTPLHLAASEGRVIAVQFLINSDVPLTPVDRWGGTPLSDAKLGNHPQVEKLLMEAIHKNEIPKSNQQE